MLGDVVLVLGQAVARRDVRELLRAAEAVRPARHLVVQERDRRGRVVRMERVLHRRLDRLVVLRERSIDHAVAEQAADAFAVHDERQPGLRIVRVHRRRVVRDVADPLAAVPGDARSRRIPRLAVEVGRRTVVHHTPIERPAPRPVRIEAHARRIVRLRVADAGAALHQVARVRVAACVDPVSRRRRAVVLEVGKGRQALAGGEVEAVDLLGDLVELGLQRIFVLEGHGHDRIGELPALVLVELLHPAEDVGQDPVVMAGLALRRHHLVLPLRPAAAVHERAVLLDPVGGRHHEHLGLNRRGSGARRVPELRARSGQRVHHHQPLQAG